MARQVIHKISVLESKHGAFEDSMQVVAVLTA